MRPKIQEIVPQQTTAIIAYLHPSIIPDGVQVTRIIVVTEEPQDGGKGTNKCGRKPKAVEFKEPCSPGNTGSPAQQADQQQHEGTVTNLEAEREYSMKLRLHYSTGGYVDSEAFPIKTQYTGKYRIYRWHAYYYGSMNVYKCMCTACV